jgi:hypothetical protein
MKALTESIEELEQEKAARSTLDSARRYRLGAAGAMPRIESALRRFRSMRHRKKDAVPKRAAC